MHCSSNRAQPLRAWSREGRDPAPRRAVRLRPGRRGTSGAAACIASSRCGVPAHYVEAPESALNRCRDVTCQKLALPMPATAIHHQRASPQSLSHPIFSVFSCWVFSGIFGVFRQMRTWGERLHQLLFSFVCFLPQSISFLSLFHQFRLPVKAFVSFAVLRARAWELVRKGTICQALLGFYLSSWSSSSSW